MDLNLATAHEAIAAAIPDRECIVFRDRRFTWAEVTDRTRRLANALLARGLGAVVEREGLAGHESGQDHLAIYLYNGNEYLEAMLGAFKARVAPFNVNYRYVAEELRTCSPTRARRRSSYHSRVRADARRGAARRCPTLRRAPPGRRRLGQRRCCPGAVWYEDALAAASPRAPPVDAVARRPLHPLHRRHHRHAQGRAVAPGRHLRRVLSAAGATTAPPSRTTTTFVAGAPARRRAARAARAAVHARRRPLDELPHLARAAAPCSSRAIPSASTPSTSGRSIEREQVNFLLIVGDAFARPLLDELDRNTLRPLARSPCCSSGGAPLSAPAEGASSSRICRR